VLEDAPALQFEEVMVDDTQLLPESRLD